MFKNFPSSMESKQSNRWFIAVAGVVMQLALGAAYAWSVFRMPLTTAYGWSISQVMLTFELAILVLGLAAFAGGLWMRTVGSRRVAITGGVGYGLGTILAGQDGSSTALMHVSHGILGGIGLGLGYIVPLATLIKWFPDRRGMITGLAVAGFGGGALVTAPVAEYLLRSGGIASTFVILGTIYLIAVVGAAVFMKDPPEGYRPEGWTPPAPQQSARATKDNSLAQALRSWQWYALWAILFLNTSAGISISSQGSPMAQEMTHVTAPVAAGPVGPISIANGSGRLLWGWISDFTGRPQMFLTMFFVQAVVFLILSHVERFTSLALLCFIVLLCYGGGFGTMPAFAADRFGPGSVGSISGLMLTAWGGAGVLGPTVIAWIQETTGHYTEALEVIAAVMLASAVIPFFVRRSNETTIVPSHAGRSLLGTKS
jgi:OFA family oxalate/formate antiporter-like MFS transporter